MLNRKKLLTIFIIGSVLLFSPALLIRVHENFELKFIASSLKKVTASALKDPESAKFRNLELKSSLISRSDRLAMLWDGVEALGLRDGLIETLKRGEVILCGEVNARNEFGGYAGFTTFYARLDDPPKVFIDSTSSQYSLLNTFSKTQCDGERVLLMKIDD
jgi:hypothetical protein